MVRDKGKGKAKAVEHPNAGETEENQRLLDSMSRSYRTANNDVQNDDEESPLLLHQRRREDRRGSGSKIRSILLTALVVLATLAVGVTLFLVLLAASYSPSPSELSSLPKTAFAYSSPDSVSVLNITDDGLLLNLTVRCGIDADRALGVQWFSSEREKDSAAERGERGVGAEWWEKLRRWTAHRALKSLDQPSVNVNVSSSIHIYPHRASSSPLLSVKILDSLQIPLVWDIPQQAPNDEPTWLQPLAFTALAKPLASTGELWEFIQRGWVEGSVRVKVEIATVQAKPAEKAWWAKYGEIEKEDLDLDIEVPIPRLPHLPDPGHPLNLSELVTLRHYEFDTFESPKALAIEAAATIPNFLPNLTTTVCFGLPFSIALPDLSTGLSPIGDTKMAEVVTAPINIGGSRKEIELRMKGIVTADLSDQTQKTTDSNGTSVLSHFLQNYLHGKDNPILVQGMASLPPFAPASTIQPPSWLLSTLPSLSLSLTFPGPKPPPNIIQSVTIDHMRLTESRGKMKASGTVIAQVELPQDMQNVDIEVVQVRPDVLVYDGPAPLDSDDDGGDIPAKAFGHINPNEFLNSTTSPSGDPRFPHQLIVSAPLSNVDLDILPGRDGVLSEFVSKVVFKGGAQAGVKGIASVRVRTTGVDGTVRLDGLPVRGEFWVGKQRG
ncbi:hypothetical protein I317_02353 [Kwoniella heveanensis CBS 569]|nr:hypothetical protein I317_02353 [Kwoniella heveanensis CBS 569]